MNIRHEPQSRRFVADIDGAEATLDYTVRDDGVLDFRRTFTPPSLRGQGIAKTIVVFGLDYARDNAIKIIPTCPYVAKIIRENPEYEDFVAEVV